MHHGLTFNLIIRFDVETRHAFVGDQSGQVTILKLEQDNCSLVTTFKGHTGTSHIHTHILINNIMNHLIRIESDS